MVAVRALLFSLLSLLVVADDNFFKDPTSDPSVGQPEQSFHDGDTKVVVWNTTWDHLNLNYYSQKRPNAGPYFHQYLASAASTTKATVTVRTADPSFGSVFFFQIQTAGGGPDARANSGLFTVLPKDAAVSASSAAPSSASSAAASSASASSGSTVASSAAASTASPTDTSAPSSGSPPAMSIGLGVGLGVGIPLIAGLAAAALVWRRRRGSRWMADGVGIDSAPVDDQGIALGKTARPDGVR